MSGVFSWLFGSARFVPHGYCLLWRPDLVAIHVVSDALIALAYFAIPLAIYSFIRQRGDLKPEHKWMAMLFVAFIMWCGLTHVASIVTLWAPYYGLQAILKAITALVSVITAAALPFVIPKLLQIPSPEALGVANGRLQAEVNAHQSTLRSLKSARDELERQVAERTEDLRVANARFEAALAGSQVSLFEQDAAGRYTWVYNAVRGWNAEAVLGRTPAEIMAPDAAALLTRMHLEAMQLGEQRRSEVQVPGAAGEEWYETKIGPARLRTGCAGTLAVSTDITAQKTQQRHLELVMRELNHRAKNVLAIVQSLARQTAKTTEVSDAYLRTFNDRLRALAATHDELVRRHWRGADLRSVVESQLKQQIDAFPGRIALSGPDVELPAETAHYVGLALHELGVNAAKFGALSTEGGRVDLSWTLQPRHDAAPKLTLRWRESGGPPVQPPARGSFGRSLLEQLAPRALVGEASLEFAPEGLSWTLVAPLRPETPAASAA